MTTTTTILGIVTMVIWIMVSDRTFEVFKKGQRRKRK